MNNSFTKLLMWTQRIPYCGHHCFLKLRMIIWSSKKKRWTLFSSWHIIEVVFHQHYTVEEVIFLLLRQLNEAQVERFTAFLWSTWKSINLKLWQNVVENNSQIAERASQLLEDWNQLQKESYQTRCYESKRNDEQLMPPLRPIRPAPSRYKCIVDTIVNVV